MSIETVSIDEYNVLKKQCEQEVKFRIENNQFHYVALNLSGRRGELEDKAQELIDAHGRLKALEISKHSTDNNAIQKGNDKWKRLI